MTTTTASNVGDMVQGNLKRVGGTAFEDALILSRGRDEGDADLEDPFVLRNVLDQSLAVKRDVRLLSILDGRLLLETDATVALQRRLVLISFAHVLVTSLLFSIASIGLPFGMRYADGYGSRKAQMVLVGDADDAPLLLESLPHIIRAVKPGAS